MNFCHQKFCPTIVFVTIGFVLSLGWCHQHICTNFVFFLFMSHFRNKIIFLSWPLLDLFRCNIFGCCKQRCILEIRSFEVFLLNNIKFMSKGEILRVFELQPFTAQELRRIWTKVNIFITVLDNKAFNLT